MRPDIRLEAIFGGRGGCRGGWERVDGKRSEVERGSEEAQKTSRCDDAQPAVAMHVRGSTSMRPVMMSILRNWEVHGGLAAVGGYVGGSLWVGLVEELCLRRDRVGGSRWDVNDYLNCSLGELPHELLIDGIEMSL